MFYLSRKFSVFLTIGIVLTYSMFMMSTEVVKCVDSPNMLSLAQMENHTIQVRLSVNIFEIDQAQRFASVEFSLWFDKFPYNATKIYADIRGNGFISIECDYKGVESYHGQSGPTTWYLAGSGEMYPFDSYTTQFELETQSVHFGRGNSTYVVGEEVNYTLSYSHAWFSGPNIRSLRDTWLTTDGVHNLPIESSAVGLTARIERKWLIPLCQFLLPIIFCYYFLGASMLISRPDLTARLRVYFSLFIFAPTFFFAIRPFLPYRSSLSIPEFLLTNLVTSSAVFGICSMIPEKPKDGVSIADGLAIFVSVLGLAVLGRTFLPTLSAIGPFLVMASVEISYFYAVVLRALYGRIID